MGKSHEKTTLYRLYDANDVLLYVGISGRWLVRMGQHATKKGWWDDVATVKRQVFPSRAEALAAEATAIRDERPLHNIQGKPAQLSPRRLSSKRPKILGERTSPPAEFTRILDRMTAAHRETMAALRTNARPELIQSYLNEIQPLYLKAAEDRADNILRVREELNPTLEELAAYVGVSKARVAQIISAAKRRRAALTV